MIEKGQTLVNPVTGERMTFLETAAAKPHFDTVRLPVVPAWTQKAALAMGSPFGEAMGYGATYTTERSRLERLVPRAA